MLGLFELQEHLEEVDKLSRSLGKGKSVHKVLREKDNELQEILRNMSSWKEQTAEKLATKFQQEMSRELEKYNHKHLIQFIHFILDTHLCQTVP